MKHKKTAAVIASVLFAIILLISFRLIFTVGSISVDYSICSAETEKEISEAKEKLNTFLGKNTFSVRESEVFEYLAGYAYFEVEEVKVCFPREIRVKVKERREAFVAEKNGKFFFFDENIFVLSEKNDNVSRADGKPLTIIDGDVPDLKGNTQYSGEDELFGSAIKFVFALEDARNEIAKITVSRYDNSEKRHEWNRIIVETEEGAVFTISEATVLADKKVELFKTVYASLEGEDRVNGRYTIFTSSLDDSEVDYE